MYLFANFLLTFCIFLLAFLVSVFCSLFCISAIFFWIVQYQKQENTFLYFATIIIKKHNVALQNPHNRFQHLQNPYSIFYFLPWFVKSNCIVACWYLFFMVSKIHITDSNICKIHIAYSNLFHWFEKYLYIFACWYLCCLSNINIADSRFYVFSLIWNIFFYICLLIFVFLIDKIHITESRF